MKLAIYLPILLFPLALKAAEWPPSLTASKSPTINGRNLETYQHGIQAKWGYEKPQEDTFVVVHPEQKRKNAPLYVVLHSAGHDVHSALNCTKTIGNHDIYRSPRDHYALYLDCRKNRGDWWWGGMHRRGKKLIEKNSGPDLVPVEKRVIACVKWVIKKYGIDPNRVYLSGNSMGGSGTLGIGMRHGDVFAAIKANVPAGIEHVSHRMQFPPFANKKKINYPDPPVCINYSGQNDGWAIGHDRFIQAMNERKYALYMYWGPFGHANNSAQIKKTNDLIDSLDWLSIKRNEAYPVFIGAKSDNKHPWPDETKSKESGQINGFFRWKNLEDTKDRFKILLFVASTQNLKTQFKIPNETTTSVTLRRIQNLKIKPGEAFSWSYGSNKGEGKVDSEGLITIENINITNQRTALTIEVK